jgi:hypothetical protein
MARHLHLVPAGTDLLEEESALSVDAEDTNVVDLDTERRIRRHYRYHPSAGKRWLDDLFDDDPLDPVC